MRILINAHEREIGLLALALGDKECESARKGLERLRLEPMPVMALQGNMTSVRKNLNDKKRSRYDWDYSQRAAFAIALRLYGEQLRKLVDRELQLVVDASSTEGRRGVVRDFIARLAGQDTFWTEPVEEPTAQRADNAPTDDQGDWTADADDVDERPSAPGAPLPSIVEQLVIRMDAHLAKDDAIRALESLATACEIGDTRFEESAFKTIARAAIRMAKIALPGGNGEYWGPQLLQEMVGDEVNAIALGAWIREKVRLALGDDDAPPPKLSDEAVKEIRASVEPEVGSAIVNPLDVHCYNCGAAPGVPCSTSGGKVLASEPHRQRRHAALDTLDTPAPASLSASNGEADQADVLYMDAVLVQLFGRADDELRVAVTKRRSIDLKAKWVTDMRANAGGAEARA